MKKTKVSVIILYFLIFITVFAIFIINPATLLIAFALDKEYIIPYVFYGIGLVLFGILCNLLFAEYMMLLKIDKK